MKDITKDTLLTVAFISMLAVIYGTMRTLDKTPETISPIPAPCYEPQALQDYKDRYELQKRID